MFIFINTVIRITLISPASMEDMYQVLNVKLTNMLQSSTVAQAERLGGDGEDVVLRS